MNEHDPRPSDGDCGVNAAPYVLGALPEAEHEAFVIHLASCAVCREEVAALQGVAAMLPAAVPQREAPAELKQRVMTEVRAEAKRQRASESAGGRAPFLRGARWRIPALVPLGLAAALAIALAVVLVSGGGESRRIEAQVSAPGARAALFVSSGQAQLRIAHMPGAGAGRVYEVWIERTGPPSPTATLFTVTSSGRATVGIPGSLEGVKEVLVTSEPAGGTLVPTRTPVIVAKLT